VSFTVTATDATTSARCGVLATRHGAVETPVFMPVGTRASVKAVTPDDLDRIGVKIILSNTYHVLVRPGIEIVEGAGGLHRFMGWERPILTDSGGYQVFSLARLRKITDDGAAFLSHVDGAPLFLGPREAMEAQRRLGSDIAMIFDECPPWPCSYEHARMAVQRTSRWARVCLEEPRADGQLLFGIVQGSTYPDLRRDAALDLVGLPFDGFAVGGLSVGEPESEMFETLEVTVEVLPEDKPRYLMGVGTPPQILRAIACGVDMFDCVLPTRMARNGTAFTASGPITVKAGRYKADYRPIEESCSCYACRNFSRAYIRHLLNVNEILGAHLMTIHNLHFYMRLLEDARDAVRKGVFAEFEGRFLKSYTAAEST